MPLSALKRLVPAALTAVAAVVGMAIFSWFVPYNMDEFIHYDTILCYWFPGNAITGSCDQWALNLLNLGIIVPLRAYGYSGSFPALYFLPVFLLWRTPLAARLLGVVFLALDAWVLSRIFHMRMRTVFAALLLLFPFAFQHLVDTGPVGFQILSILLLSRVFSRWCATLKARYAAATTILVFLGIWTKFSYIWLVPSLGLLFLYEAWKHRAVINQPLARSRFAWQVFLSATGITLLIGVLLLSTSPQNSAEHPYILEILWREYVPLTTLLLHGGIFTAKPVLTLLHPLSASHRIFEVADHGLLSIGFSLLLYAAPPALLVALRALGAPWKALAKPALHYLLFLLVILMIARTLDAGIMHHAILSYPFLLLSLFGAVRLALDARLAWPAARRLLQPAILVAGIAFLGVNASLYVAMARQPVRIEASVDKALIHTLLNAGDVHKRYVVATLDWGLYYYQGLFGRDDQSVLYTWDIDQPGHAEALLQTAHANDRKMLFVFQNPSAVDINRLGSMMNLVPCAAIPPGATWQILAEPDPELHRVCDATARMLRKPTQPFSLTASVIL